uniref:Uncharacterized protein n=1 Tax=Dicentrarchus labrax TaxID=13489 RepID=A0A8C4F3V6_DICLA
MSKTCIMTCEVPDLDGVPPSIAVTVRYITGCFSRSSVFCRTNSADTLSPPLIVAREKYSFGVNLNALTVFFPTSASIASDKANFMPGRVFSAISTI